MRKLEEVKKFDSMFCHSDTVYKCGRMDRQKELHTQ